MKAWIIAWKDTLTRFRDRNAIILMIVAPIVLSVIMGAAFGGGDENTIQNIPFIIVNEDDGEWGALFVDILTSEELSELLEPEIVAGLPQALSMMEAGNVSATVYLPQNFSERLQTTTEEADLPALVELYTDPVERVRPMIMQTIASRVAISLGNAALAEKVAIEQLMADEVGSIDPEQVELFVKTEVTTAFTNMDEEALLNILPIDTGNANSLNPIAFFVPSMAIFFLMFTTFDGTRSILVEHREGTFMRLRSTPTHLRDILMGKVFGTVLMGFIQFLVLVIASQLFFSVDWGKSPLALVLVALSYILAATSLGTLVTALAKDVGQAASVGGVITLFFGVLGGNFFSIEDFPQWLQWVSYLAINRWGLEGLSDLTLHGLMLSDVLPEVSILLGVAITFFAISLWLLPRRLA